MLRVGRATVLRVVLASGHGDSVERRHILPDRILADGSAATAGWRGEITALESGTFPVVVEASPDLDGPPLQLRVLVEAVD